MASNVHDDPVRHQLWAKSVPPEVQSLTVIVPPDNTIFSKDNPTTPGEDHKLLPTMIKLRAERDVLLSSSDKYLMVDYPIEQDLRDKWFIYRQVLRDLPNNKHYLVLDKDGKLQDFKKDEDGNFNGELEDLVWPTPPQ